jgi:hypothetical protein
MSQPTNEVKIRWINKAYHRYTLSLRYDIDQPLIDWLQAQADQGIGTTEAIRRALTAYLEAEKPLIR